LQEPVRKAELAGIVAERRFTNEVERLVAAPRIVRVDAPKIDVAALAVVEILDDVAICARHAFAAQIEVERVASLAAVKRIPAEPSDEQALALAAIEDVVALAAIDVVVAVIAIEPVVPRVALESIVAID
jgi:hypothetical protein